MLYNPEEVVRIARLYEVIRKQEQQINTETDPVGLKVLAKDLLTIKYIFLIRQHYLSFRQWFEWFNP